MGTHTNLKDPKIEETQEVLDSIRRIVRALRVTSKANEQILGLSSAQLFVLQKLQDEKGISINELASRTVTHQSSVSAVVSKLVDQGFVQRKKAKDDERRLEISITSKGMAIIKRAPGSIQDRLVGAIQLLPPKMRRELALCLKLVVKEAGISDEPAPLFFEENKNESE